MAGEGGGGQKAVLQIPIDDEQWKLFLESFAQYQEKLASQGSAWASTNAGIRQMGTAFDSAEESFDDLVKSAESQKLTRAFSTIDKTSKETAKSWVNISKTIEKSSRDMAGLLRGGSKFAALGQFLGVGGLAVGATALFSAVKGANDSLADQNILNRKLGLAPGEEKAFDTVFEKAGGDTALLSKVAAAQANPEQWRYLQAAGFSQQDIQNSDPVTLSSELLEKIGGRVNANGLAQTGLWAHAMGVDQFVDGNSMRLASTYSATDYAGMRQQYKDLQPQLAAQQKQLDDATAARQQIEAALAKDTLELDKAFIKLNPLVIDAAEKVTKWVTAFAESGELERDIKDVENAFSDIGKASHWLVDELNSLFGRGAKDSGLGTITGGNTAPDFHVDKDHPVGQITRDPSGHTRWAIEDWWNNLTGKDNDDTGSSGATPYNNPGNLEVPGKRGQFQQFASPEQGVLAMDRQLVLYAQRDHLNTLSGIISKYAPAKDGNNVPAYISDVAGRTGFDPSNPLDMNDPHVRAAVEAAMIHHENGKKYSQFDQQAISDLLTGKTVADASSKSAFDDPKSIKEAKTTDKLNANPEIVPFTAEDQRAKDADDKNSQQVITETLLDRLKRGFGMMGDAISSGGGAAFRSPDAPARPMPSTQQAPYNVNVVVTTPAGSSTTVTTSSLAQ